VVFQVLQPFGDDFVVIRICKGGSRRWGSEVAEGCKVNSILSDSRLPCQTEWSDLPSHSSERGREFVGEVSAMSNENFLGRFGKFENMDTHRIHMQTD